MTPEQSAARILKALAHVLQLAAGDEIPDRALRAEFERHGGLVAEIESGLLYAHSRGWIEHDAGPAKGRFRLTAEGIKAAG